MSEEFRPVRSYDIEVEIHAFKGKIFRQIRDRVYEATTAMLKFSAEDELAAIEELGKSGLSATDIMAGLKEVAGRGSNTGEVRADVNKEARTDFSKLTVDNIWEGVEDMCDNVRDQLNDDANQVMALEAFRGEWDHSSDPFGLLCEITASRGAAENAEA